MSLAQQYLSVIGSFQGLLLAFLLIFGMQVSNASRLLGVWSLFLGLNFLANFIILQPEISPFTGLYGWSNFFPASYGALLYLYCRHAIIDRPLRWLDLLHFCPLIICILLNLDILLAPPEVKLSIALTGPPSTMTFLLAIVTLFVQAFVYIGLSVHLVRKYETEARHTLSSFNPEVFSWLWTVLLLNLVIWLFKAAGTFLDYALPFSRLGDGLIVLLIYSIAMAQWRNPRLFRIEQLDDESLNAASRETLAGSHSTVPGSTHEPLQVLGRETLVGHNHRKEERDGSALDEETRSQLMVLVRRHMEEQQAFLDNQLSLSRLAEAIGVSTHHLSEVLNQHSGKNFYQFVNTYRIQYVCERLKSDPNIKILDLALLSGFSSKSTFNAVFKQFLGQTPSQFRKASALG